DLQLYTEAIRQVARRRQAVFVDEFCQRYGPASPLTDNGMHLTAYGYWWTAGPLLHQMGMPSRRLQVVELNGLMRKEGFQDHLPNPPRPPDSHATDLQADSLVVARGLKPGKYTLKIDGQPVHTADAKTWMEPPGFGRVLVLQGPSLDQAERLRKVIVEKNRLYFHRWRPQNETYLFGFRKHEQGQNAREIPQVDPLVAKLEQDIARLRVPAAHTYELVPNREKRRSPAPPPAVPRPPPPCSSPRRACPPSATPASPTPTRNWNAARSRSRPASRSTCSPPPRCWPSRSR